MMLFLEVLAAAIIGAVALSILTVAYHWVFFRRVLGDGQYVFIFLLTVPLGAVFGVLTSHVKIYLLLGHPHVAAGVACWGGGLPTALFVLVNTIGHCDEPLERLKFTLCAFGSPLVWSILLLLAGLRLRAG